jgi:hypothetical protein
MDFMSFSSVSATCIASDSTIKPENEDGRNCEMFTQKYVFRSELFNVTKPYITAGVHKGAQQTNEKEDLVNGVKKENSISIIGKVESFSFSTEDMFFIPVYQIPCDLFIFGGAGV